MSSDLKISKQQGATGGAGESVGDTTTFYRKDGTYQTPSTVNGVQTLNGGTSTAPSAPVISSPGFVSGTASQLSDTTRDYEVYFQIGTGGGTITLSMGAAAAGTAVAILTSAVGVNGELIRVRLPAGWYLKITVATSTIADQIAVGC
jgi:hypothetical protein